MCWDMASHHAQDIRQIPADKEIWGQSDCQSIGVSDGRGTSGVHEDNKICRNSWPQSNHHTLSPCFSCTWSMSEFLWALAFPRAGEDIFHEAQAICPLESNDSQVTFQKSSHVYTPLLEVCYPSHHLQNHLLMTPEWLSLSLNLSFVLGQKEPVGLMESPLQWQHL